MAKDERTKKISERRSATGSVAAGTKRANPVDVAVGMNIRRMRVAIGMSQEQLGVQSGVTFQQIQKYEKGTNRTSASRLDEFAQIFGVEHAEFFKGVENARAGKGAVSEMQLSSRAHRAARLFDAIPSTSVQQAIFKLMKDVSGNTELDDE